MKPNRDHFSAIAAKYKAGRITYPEGVYAYLCDLCEEKALAWDCATGTGQAAIDLSAHFDRVIAADISDSLLALTPEIDNVTFRNAPAERSGLAPQSVDLIAIAQAIHWFADDPFWKEADRVLKPNGVLAFWGYVWPSVTERIDELLDVFRDQTAAYWPEGSQRLHGGYADIDAPFERIVSPAFEIEEQWNASHYLAHLASWSGTRYYRESNQKDPVQIIENDLEQIWGDGQQTVKWPLILKVYRKT